MGCRTVSVRSARRRLRLPRTPALVGRACHLCLLCRDVFEQQRLERSVTDRTSSQHCRHRLRDRLIAARKPLDARAIGHVEAFVRKRKRQRQLAIEQRLDACAISFERRGHERGDGPAIGEARHLARDVDRCQHE